MLEKLIQTNQIELQVRDYEQAGEAIIFLHFSGANLMMWSRVIPYFAKQFRCILVDLRGHGKSAQPATGYHMDVMAKDIAGIMEELKLAKAHIVGSSLGAEVGLALAAGYPEKVLSLVCDGALSSEFGPYSTWEGTREEFDDHVARFLDKMHASPERTYPSVDALVEKSREDLSAIGWWNEYVEAMERYGAFQLAEGEYTPAFRKFARQDYFKNYFQYRLEDYYPRVSCPILMVPAAEVFENEQEKAAMQGLSELASRAQIASVAGWQHPYGWLIDPGGICKAILEFLR